MSSYKNNSKMQLILDIIQHCLQVIRSHVMTWSVQRPGLALSIVIFSSVFLLPLITATALMPIVFLIDLSSFLATKGVLCVLYTVLFQGVAMGLVLVVLFLAAFAIATSASVLHSYQNHYTVNKQF